MSSWNAPVTLGYFSDSRLTSSASAEIASGAASTQCSDPPYALSL